MGEAAQGRMTTHQAKKLDSAGLLAFRDRFALPMSDADTQSLAFYKPADDSAEIRYLQSRRRALGGALPARRSDCAAAAGARARRDRGVRAPRRRQGDEHDDGVRAHPRQPAEGRRRSARASCRSSPTRRAPSAWRACSARSASTRRSASSTSPRTRARCCTYREDKSGQILEEGITEAGALSSWTAAATSYSTHGLAMLPFYIYYSMFGFQRVGDLIWAAADQRARGFLIGATAGRTTLGGEGLQHQDGTSHLVAATVPNCKRLRPGDRRRARGHRRPRHARDARASRRTSSTT